MTGGDVENKTSGRVFGWWHEIDCLLSDVHAQEVFLTLCLRVVHLDDHVASLSPLVDEDLEELVHVEMVLRTTL